MICADAQKEKVIDDTTGLTKSILDTLYENETKAKYDVMFFSLFFEENGKKNNFIFSFVVSFIFMF